MDTARTYVLQERWAEAEDLLNIAIAYQYQNIDAYMLRARVREQRLDFPGAITDYTSVIYLKPDHLEARFQRGLTLLETRRYAAARTDFLYLLENPSTETNAVYYRSDTQSDPKGITGITTLQSSLHSDWLDAVGLTYYHQENYTLAQQFFCKAVSENGKNANSYVNLGLTAECQTDTTAAISYYQQALTIEPNHALATRSLAALARVRRDSTLLAKIDHLFNNDTYESLFHLGLSAINQTKYEAAVSYFTKALLLSDNYEAYLQRGFAYERLGQLFEAIADYSAAVLRDPLAEKAYSNRGNAYVKTEEYTVAIADYSRAIKLNPHNGRAYHNRGIAYHRLGQIDRACKDWQQANILDNTASAAPLGKVCNK